MKKKRKINSLVLSMVMVLSLVIFLKGRDSKLLQSFQISQDRNAEFWTLKTVYNSNLQKYVVFFVEINKSSLTIWTRIYTPEGKSAGAYQNVLSGRYFWADVAYNENEDEFLLVMLDKSIAF